MMVCNTIRLNDGSTYVRNYQALHGHLGSNPKLQRMVELSVIFFFLAHYVACIFFRIAIEEGLNLNEWTQPLQKGWDDVAGTCVSVDACTIGLPGGPDLAIGRPFLKYDPTPHKMTPITSTAVGGASDWMVAL